MSGRMPETRQEMIRAGYQFKGASQCKSCHAAIEWWLTTKGKSMPFDAPTTAQPREEVAVVHWATCPNAAQHKTTGKPSTTATRTAAPADDHLGKIQRFAEQLGVRLVVVLDDGGYTWAGRTDLEPEDIKHELITAANEIRREMGARR